MKAFLQELGKRRVIRVAVAYLIFGWIVLQVADVVLPALGLPDWTITLTLALLVLGFPLALVLSWVFDIGPEGIERTPPVQRDPDNLSIAVLPFPDLSAEQDQAHFCDGLTDELISRLARIEGLRVASRSSSFAFRNRSTELETAADKLRVAHILEGGVRKDGNRVRVSAQLTDVANDTVLWAENYDHELSDIFAIQQNIARCIQEALPVQLGATVPAGPVTSDPKAYEYYLRGRGYALYSGKRHLAMAQDMFEKATGIDSAFTDAWLALAEVAAMQALFLGGGEAARQVAARAGRCAMDLAPSEGASFLAHGLGQLACDSYEAAEEAFLKAVELDPLLFRAWHYLGRAAHHSGNPEKEVDYYKQAIDRDPDDWESPILVLSPLKKQGNEINLKKMARLAVERVEKHLEDYPDNQRAYYLGVGALFTLDEKERALDWAENAYRLAPDDPATRYNLACFYAQIGEADRALDLLENSVSSRSWIENDGDLDNLREHPRYKRYIESLPQGG